MLDAGHHRIAIGRAFTLHRFHHGFAHRSGQIRIFAKPFRGAAPARIARDIDHRRPCHIQTIIGGFIRRHPTNGSDRIEIKGGCQTETYREYGTLTVQYVVGKREGFSGG